MTRQSMTDERVLALISAYGAEPAVWPEEEREPAEAYLKAHPARFEAALTEARALDTVFAREGLPEMPPGLADRVLAEAPTAPLAHRAGRGLGAYLMTILFPNGLRWPAGVTLAALMAGLMAGFATAPATAGSGFDSDEQAVVYAALGYGDLEAYMQEVDG